MARRFGMGPRGARAVHALIAAATSFSAVAAAPALREVQWSRFGADVTVTLQFNGMAEPDSFRLWLEEARSPAPPSRRSRFKVEGLRFFRPLEDDAIAPQGWVAIEDIPAVETEGALVLLLPGRLLPSRLAWHAEILDASGRILSRFPPGGLQTLNPAQIPEARPIRDEPPDADRLSPSPDPVEGGIAALETRTWRPIDVEEHIPPVFRRVRLRLREAAEDAPPVTARPEQIDISDGAVRQSGETRGVRWQLYFIPGAPSDRSAAIFCRLESDEDRRLEVLLSYELPDGPWEWQNIQGESQPLSAAPPPDSTFEWPFGAGRQSRYPLGVVKGAGGLVVLEVPADAPRVFRIQAADSPSRLEAAFDLGLTRRTARAPLRATCAVEIHEMPAPAPMEHPPFRTAWAAWQQRRSRAVRRQTRPADVSGFMEPSIGPDFASEGIVHAHSLTAERRCLVTNPFHVRWPVDTLQPPRAEDALRRLRFFAAFDPGALGLAARTALLAGARDATGAPLLRFEGREAVWEVYAHPNFFAPSSQPLNRGQAEWALIRAALARGGVGSVLINDFGACRTLDLNPAALAVAEGPATWIRDPPAIGLATPLAAFDYLGPLRRRLSESEKALALFVSETLHPIATAVADVFVVSSRTLQRDDTEAFADALRALAGARPVIVRFDDPPASLDRLQADLESWLYRGFLPWVEPPGFAAGDEPGSWDSMLRRGLLHTYGPWLIRVALAEWHPIGGARPRTRDWRLESFGPDNNGSRFITARRAVTASEIGEIVISLEKPALLLAPFSGQCLAVAPTRGAPRVRVRLAAGRTGFWMLAPLESLDQELAFLRSWRPPDGEGHALWVNLRNATIEQEARVHSAWRRGPNGAPVFRLRNGSDSPVALSGLRFGWGAPSPTAAADLRILAPGEELHIPVEPAPPLPHEKGWLSAQWRLARADREWECASRIRLTDIGALAVAEETNRP